MTANTVSMPPPMLASPPRKALTIIAISTKNPKIPTNHTRRRNFLRQYHSRRRLHDVGVAQLLLGAVDRRRRDQPVREHVDQPAEDDDAREGADQRPEDAPLERAAQVGEQRRGS